MSTAGLPTFKKLWGRIDHDLPEGKYSITITNNYDVSDFKGSKSFVLTTTSNLGGKMSFLGIISLVVGALSVVGGGMIFGVIYFLKKRGIEI